MNSNEIQGRVLLGITGSIGAKDSVKLIGLLCAKHEVQVVASASSPAFFDLASAQYATTCSRRYFERGNWESNP
ncbi:flavoprotein [Pandoraea terrigena]|uniref:Flavoprotein domain-containing protein n=1 Tax=Pandoraea terrigena TaxID=2508292 RepID=A0A5E4VX79_9BURK|nr:hypothetical protein PTE31013_02957 [Pandoraea terrigena]